MKENYRFLRAGHLYQTEVTGIGPQYSIEYCNYYNNIPSDAMSEIRYNIVKQYVKEFDSICDFGYGNGAFIRYCQSKGHTSHAYDISDYPVPEGVHSVSDIDNLEVDVMTFFDSIEHIVEEDLVSFLNNKKAKYFVISVPWFHEFLGVGSFKNWKHRKPNEHFHHFDVHGLVGLLTDANCSIIHIGNEEDQIRKPVDMWPNILTVVAKKNI